MSQNKTSKIKCWKVSVLGSSPVLYTSFDDVVSLLKEADTKEEYTVVVEYHTKYYLENLPEHKGF